MVASRRPAPSKARQTLPTVAIADLHMTRTGDMTALREISRAVPEMSIVVLTSGVGGAPAADAVRTVANEYVTKPVDPGALFLAAERAIDRKKQSTETDLVRRPLAELRDAHAALQAERDFVSTVLATIESPVVVVGAEGRIVHF